MIKLHFTVSAFDLTYRPSYKFLMWPAEDLLGSSTCILCMDTVQSTGQPQDSVCGGKCGPRRKVAWHAPGEKLQRCTGKSCNGALERRKGYSAFARKGRKNKLPPTFSGRWNEISPNFHLYPPNIICNACAPHQHQQMTFK